MEEEVTVYRGGMLQRNEQLAKRAAGGSNEIPLPRPEFLIEFVRAIIKNNPNGDILYLSIMAAADKTNASKDEIKMLTQAVRDISAGPTPWPKGFYPEL